METEHIIHRTETNQSWTSQYYSRLRDLGWRFATNNATGKISSTFVAANDENAPELLNSWRANDSPIEISIVIVVPNGDVSELPARVLSYSSSALNFASSLKRSAVEIGNLRIISPCHANVYANGGNLESQLDNAKKMQKLIQSYKENYLPELDNLAVTLDTGNPITQNVQQYLMPRVSCIQNEYPDIADELSRVSQRYNVNGDVHHLMDESQRSLTYLLTHPPAWGYSEEVVLFGRNGDKRINYMPASELRYLEYMKRIEGRAWNRSTDKQIATLISAKQTHAPYHAILRDGPWGNEPSIGDLTQEPSILQISLNHLRHYSGRTEVAEVIGNLNQLKGDTEQANRKRIALGLGKAPALHDIVSRSLK